MFFRAPSQIGQPHPAVGRRSRVEAAAVIMDGERDNPAHGREGHFHARGLCVLENVVQRFLEDQDEIALPVDGDARR